MFTYNPAEVHVPAGKPVTFRLTSIDVTHGFQIVGTNGNTMIVPGYSSQFTTTFAQPGAYAVPLWQHLQMPRFGSPGFKPF